MPSFVESDETNCLSDPIPIRKSAKVEQVVETPSNGKPFFLFDDRAFFMTKEIH